MLGKDAYSAVAGGVFLFAHKVKLNIATFSWLFFEGIKEDRACAWGTMVQGHSNVLKKLDMRCQ